MNRKIMPVVSLLLVLPVLVKAQNDRPVSSVETHKEISFPDAGLLVIRVDQGAKVEISPGNANTANITAFYQVKDKKDAGQLKSCALVISDKGDSTVITSVCPEGVKAADLQLKVLLPSKANVNLVMGGGYLEIKGITGYFNVDSYGGYFIFEQLSGVLNAKVFGGKVRVANSTLEGNVSLVGGTVERDNVKGGLVTSE